MLPASCLLLKPRQLLAMPTRIYSPVFVFSEYRRLSWRGFHRGIQDEGGFSFKVATDADHPLHSTSRLQWTHNRSIDVFCFDDKIVYNIPLYNESQFLGDKHCLSITIPIAKDGSPERVLFWGTRLFVLTSSATGFLCCRTVCPIYHGGFYPRC